MSAIRVTRVRNNKGPLTKTYALDVQGGLTKTVSAQMYDGSAETIECADLQAFMEQRSHLNPNEALVFGLTGRSSVGITTQKELREHPHRHVGKIARDAESLHYARGAGILMLDHDADHMPEAYDRDALRAAWIAAVPELEFAPMAWATSASSHIHNAETGEELQGLRGQRGYVPLADATDIPRVGRVIYERLWAAGYGAFVVSDAGALLDRNLIDASAWQAERIDFAAGARCVAPLEQRAPDFHIWEAEIIGGTDPWCSKIGLPDLTDAQREAAAKNRSIARALVEGRALEARAQYIDRRAAALVIDRGIPLESARELIRDAVESRLLFADFVLHPEDGEPVTVGQVLDDPSRWHGTRFADPIEPSYRNDRRIAYCNLHSGGRPYLFSHAHGLEQRYELVRQPAQLKVQPGETSRLADESLRIMRKRGDVYDFGTAEMARVADGRIIACTRPWVLDYLGQHVRFTRHDGRARKGEDPNKPTDCPDKVAEIIISRTGERNLPRLRGVVTAPTLRVDGSVLDRPGFDEATGLLYLSEDLTPARVRTNPSQAEVAAALRELMEPIQLFPFADAASRGVALAGLLTACVRRSLPRAPGFGFDAPTPGTGKSLLANCQLALAGLGAAPHKQPGSDEEMGKVLFAALRGGDGAVYFDNCIAPIGGSAIDGFLTAELYSGRILGSSVLQSALPNGAMVLFTGNNLVTQGDTCRRVLVCRLDARVEHPSRRSFEFNPEQFVRSRRPRLVRAALTLVRGYLESGATPKPNPLGSFEEWDALVRQTVCWLGDVQTEFELADPNLTTERAGAADEGKAQLAGMLGAWQDAFGNTPVTSAQAVDFARSVFDDFDDARPTADRDAQSAKGNHLRVALAALARHPRDEIDGTRLGYWLRKHRERVADGLRFESVPARSGVMQWFAAPAAQ